MCEFIEKILNLTLKEKLDCSIGILFAVFFLQKHAEYVVFVRREGETRRSNSHSST